MKSTIRPHQLVLRLAIGASVLASGLRKRKADECTAVDLHAMAVDTCPFLDKVDPVTFTRALSAGQITLGGALLVPLIPNKPVGAGLSVFAVGVLGTYLRAPGMHRPRSLAPTPEGLGLSKDLWLLGAGLSLALEGRERRDRVHP